MDEGAPKRLTNPTNPKNSKDMTWEELVGAEAKLRELDAKLIEDEEKLRKEMADMDTADWNKWYQKTRADIISQIAKFDLMIELYKKTPNIDRSPLAYISPISGLLDFVVVLLDNQNEQRQKLRQLEQVPRLKSELSTLRTDLVTSIETTDKTLKAINAFVERYTPLLAELDDERRFKANIGDTKH